ncbi:MAG: hypothetical protein ACPLKS_06090 [Caldisericum exile]|uniref:hypothetical protein n=1 Tax=Caldisericum exile TaxID=693075 RepID=UPI003C7180B1
MVNVEINPENQTILSTEKLKLKAVVSNETGNVTYQWSVNGENVTGATNDAFIFDPEYTLGDFTVGVYVEDEEPSNATAETTVSVVSGVVVKDAIEVLKDKIDVANTKLDSVKATLVDIDDAL